MEPELALGLLLGLVFLVTVLAVLALGFWLFGPERIIRRRVSELVERQHPDADRLEGAFTVHVDKPLHPVESPVAGWERSRLRSRLVRSGLRSDSAVKVTFLAKILAALALPAVIMSPLVFAGVVTQESPLMLPWLLALAFLGYLGPDIYLDSKARQRHRELETVLPDTLDLLVVCVEAGLSLDGAIQRVGQEIRHASEAMSDELRLVTLEMRAGKRRSDALRALAERTGLEDLKSMISVLIQAEGFGTSIGDALGNHASELRTIRIQRARERAAKLPVKLTFPIVLFIFPAIFLVILGPALIRIFAGITGLAGG